MELIRSEKVDFLSLGFSKVLVLVLGIMCLYFSTPLTLSSYDNFPALLTSASLISEGNVELGEFTPSQTTPNPCLPFQEPAYYLRCTPSGIYSAYPLGMMVFALPLVILAKGIGKDIRDPAVLWPLCKIGGVIVATLSVIVLYFLLLNLVSPSVALVTSFFFAVGSANFSTVSQGLWTQGGVTLGILGWLLLRLRKGDPSPVLEGLVLCFLFACRLSALVFIVPFLMVSVLSSRKAGIISLLVFSAGSFLVSVYYFGFYQHPLGPQWSMAQRMGVSETPGVAALGLLFSPGRGLFVYQPWLVFLGLWFLPTVRKEKVLLTKGTGLLGLALGVSVLLHFALIARWPMWWGGWCWGSRLLTEVIPALTLAAIVPIQFLMRSKQGKVLLGVLLLFSSAIQAVGIYSPKAMEWMTNAGGKRTIQTRLWSWREPPFLYWTKK